MLKRLSASQIIALYALQLMVSKGQTGLNFMHRPESDIGHKRFMFSCNRNAAIPQPIRWQALHDLS